MAPRKAKPPQRIELVYKLDGQLKEMDVFRLAPALLATGEIIQEGHRQLDVKHEVGVNVKPFGKGSFVVEIILFVKNNWALLGLTAAAVSEAITHTTEVLEAIGMIRSKAESMISAIKKLRGRADKVEQVKPGEYRYSNSDNSVTVNGSVHNLLQNPVIHARAVLVFGNPVQQEGVAELDTYLKDRRDETEVKITREDAEVFQVFSGVKIPDAEPIREEESAPTSYFLHPKRLSAEGEPNEWSFRSGKDIITIDKISDTVFLGRVKRGEYRLSSNDLIEALVVLKQKISGTRILSESKEIIRVVSYKAAPAQGELFLPGE